jgi:DNA-binding transcriptional LysR family regulator
MPNPHALPLDRLVWFVAVAESGGFTAAAKRLGCSKTMLSQQIAKLEAELKVSLFVRTTRHVRLTEAGERLLEECAAPLKALSASVEGVAEREERASGPLRITAPPDYASAVLGQALGEFTRDNPGVRIDLVASSELLDLTRERIDLALRLGWLRDSSLRATRLGEFAQIVAAAPAYLARAGMPKHPRDLAELRWVELSLLRAPLRWLFKAGAGAEHEVRMQAHARANSPEALLGLLRGGLGISVLADFAAEADLRSGALARVLPQWSLPRGGIYAVHPASRQVPLKVRKFVAFFRDYLARRA